MASTRHSAGEKQVLPSKVGGGRGAGEEGKGDQAVPSVSQQQKKEVDTLRVVLLGKTGVGKSSLGNSLLSPPKRKETFKVGKGLRAKTEKCTWAAGYRNDMRVEVTDTPPLCDAAMNDEEVAKIEALADPGPLVIIFTARCDRRFTDEDLKALENLKAMFSMEMEKFLIIVFNGLDGYSDKETMEEKRDELNEELSTYGEVGKLLDAAGHRYFSMDNNASDEDMEEQTDDLINMMVDLIKENKKKKHESCTIPGTSETKATTKDSKDKEVDILRVLLLGRKDSGKSSLGNSLLFNTTPFKPGRGLKSETRNGSWDVRQRNGLKVEVIDTPGLCDTHLDDEVIYKEVAKSVALANPGPHVLIFTTRCDRRFTNEELKAYKTIQEMFCEEMNKFLVIVFNGLDVYDNKKTTKGKRKELAKEIARFGEDLEVMLKTANHRYFGMNNKAPQEEVDNQIEDLIKMMMELVKTNEYRCYTTPVTTHIGTEVEKLTEKYAEENQVSKEEAAQCVKEQIVNEATEPGFLESVGGWVWSSASGITKACSVM